MAIVTLPEYGSLPTPREGRMQCAVEPETPLQKNLLPVISLLSPSGSRQSSRQQFCVSYDLHLATLTQRLGDEDHIACPYDATLFDDISL